MENKLVSNIELIPHLFRTEYSKLVSVLSKLFGIQHIEMAEDIASETFLLAVDTWPYKGIPENPVAWLYAVAKNKAKNQLNRNKIFKDKISERIKDDGINQLELEIDFSERNIADSQLQMLFTICHPSISDESQISLALRVLCGFGIDEIANAFLLSKETINKRLQRAKEKLRSEKIQMDLPEKDQLKLRLDSVVHTLYLLFSEGYYSESHDSIIRKELCLEAMNLTYLLLNNNLTNTHSINSLMSLMCFHASRLEARISEKGEIILYNDQDEKLWNKELIEKGFYYLQQASQWEISSRYYLEASIAYWHTVKNDSKEKWESILHLYDALIVLDDSPMITLNRIYVLSKVKGITMAILEAEKLKLVNNHFYFILLSELYKDLDKKKAKGFLEKAYIFCKTETEKKLVKKKIEKLN